MMGHSHRSHRAAVLGMLVFAAAAAIPLETRAQPGTSEGVQVDAFTLQPTSSIFPLAMPPGGFIRITGSMRYDLDGSMIDAAMEQTPQGRHEVGMIDPVASGLELSDRDEANHIYTYRAANPAGSACASVGLAPPCIVLRIPALAAGRLRDVDELREGLSGALQVTVHQPMYPQVFTPPQPFPVQPMPYPVYGGTEPEPDTSMYWVAAGGSGAGLLLGAGVLALVFRRRRRRGLGPLGRVLDSGHRLRRKLTGDKVKERLLTVVDDLVREARSLQALEKRLEKAVKEAKPDALEKRRDELLEAAKVMSDRGGEEAGQGELTSAAKIVDGQLDRCRKWDMQRWRSAARIERIATRLEALEAELRDPTLGTAEPKQELLDVLQEELDLARAGEREAQKLLGGGHDDSNPSAAAA
jgi:hypothetical protein